MALSGLSLCILPSVVSWASKGGTGSGAVDDSSSDESDEGGVASKTLLLTALYGMTAACSGVTVTMNPLMFVETFGEKRLSSAFGVMTTGFGIALLGLPTCMGWLRGLARTTRMVCVNYLSLIVPYMI